MIDLDRLMEELERTERFFACPNCAHRMSLGFGLGACAIGIVRCPACQHTCAYKDVDPADPTKEAYEETGTFGWIDYGMLPIPPSSGWHRE